VLLLLTERAGQAVSREEIHQHIWGTDTFVDFERGINFSINQNPGRTRRRCGEATLC
jgi:DNA-binding response OmpR family regulator